MGSMHIVAPNRWREDRAAFVADASTCVGKKRLPRQAINSPVAAGYSIDKG
ncbi:hypothetical protein ACWKW9_10790 [Rhizobium daejeonense]